MSAVVPSNSESVPVRLQRAGKASAQPLMGVWKGFPREMSGEEVSMVLSPPPPRNGVPPGPDEVTGFIGCKSSGTAQLYNTVFDGTILASGISWGPGAASRDDGLRMRFTPPDTLFGDHPFGFNTKFTKVSGPTPNPPASDPSKPKLGIANCHDFTIYRLTKSIGVKTMQSRTDLEKLLGNWTPPYRKIAELSAPMSARLARFRQLPMNETDVFIQPASNGHSGHVGRNGTLEHFIMQTGSAGKLFTEPEVLMYLNDGKAFDLEIRSTQPNPKQMLAPEPFEKLSRIYNGPPPTKGGGIDVAPSQIPFSPVDYWSCIGFRQENVRKQWFNPEEDEEFITLAINGTRVDGKYGAVAILGTGFEDSSGGYDLHGSFDGFGIDARLSVHMMHGQQGSAKLKLVIDDLGFKLEGDVITPGAHRRAKSATFRPLGGGT